MPTAWLPTNDRASFSTPYGVAYFTFKTGAPAGDAFLRVIEPCMLEPAFFEKKVLVFIQELIDRTARHYFGIDTTPSASSYCSIGLSERGVRSLL